MLGGKGTLSFFRFAGPVQHTPTAKLVETRRGDEGYRRNRWIGRVVPEEMSR